MFDAAQRIKEKKPVIERSLGDGKKFIMSLSINEMIRVGDGPDAKYYRVQLMDSASNQITFRLHTAAKIDNNEERLFAGTNAMKKAGFVKITVDPIGRVRLAND